MEIYGTKKCPHGRMNSTLITNMASLQLDDSIHTHLLISFFKNRTHSTKFLNKTSSALSINSSVVQGLVLGTSSFIIINYLPSNYPKIKAILASLDERLFSRVTNNPHHVLNQILHLSSLHPVICEDERTITPKQFTLSTKKKHSFLVFSILNKLITLIVHHF